MGLLNTRMTPDPLDLWHAGLPDLGLTSVFETATLGDFQVYIDA